MTRPAKQACENRVRDRGLCCSRSGGLVRAKTILSFGAASLDLCQKRFSVHTGPIRPRNVRWYTLNGFGSGSSSTCRFLSRAISFLPLRSASDTHTPPVTAGSSRVLCPVGASKNQHIGIGMVPLHQRLEPRLHLLCRGVRLEAERIERLALGIAHRRNSDSRRSEARRAAAPPSSWKMPNGSSAPPNSG
jgi:hypothetical protein